MKYNAPEGCTGISVGGEQFNVDENGQIEVPETGDYHSLLAPHGFKPEPVKAKPAAEIAAELQAQQEAKALAEAEESTKAAIGETSGETADVANTAPKSATKKAATKAAIGK